jgi:RHS repeat-associated protein
VKVGNNPAVTTSYDTAGFPTSSSDGSSFTFDAAGNMTQVTQPSRNWTFTFDSWNRTKTAVAGGGNPSITYGYDALDRMIQRVRNTATVYYKYIGTGEDVATAAGGSTTSYAYDSGGPVAQSQGGTVKLYVPNLHGDLALVANTSHQVTGTQAYKPFGEKGTGTGDSSIFSFQSDLTDADTGLIDMGTRLYDPQTGRFSTRDSLFGDLKAPTSLNQYVYGGDNPVSMVDPDGMCYRDPDNQTGCGYTMGSNKRYDKSFGKKPWGWICWSCAARPMTTTRGIEVMVAPSPPAPPKPTVMLNAGSALVLQRAARLTAMNAEPPEFDTKKFGRLQADAAAAEAAKQDEGGCHGFFGCIAHGIKTAAGNLATHKALGFAVHIAAAAAGAAFCAGTGGVGCLLVVGITAGLLQTGGDLLIDAATGAGSKRSAWGWASSALGYSMHNIAKNTGYAWFGSWAGRGPAGALLCGPEALGSMPT